jgi:hypothetical protein
VLLIDLPGNLLHFRLQPSIKVQKTLRQRYVRQRGIDNWSHEDEVFVGAPEGLRMPVAGGSQSPRSSCSTRPIRSWFGTLAELLGLISYWRRFGCPVECQEMRLNPNV